MVFCGLVVVGGFGFSGRVHGNIMNAINECVREDD